MTAPSPAPLQLLLRARAQREAILPHGLHGDALTQSPTPGSPAASELSGYLWDEGADANDLPAQRWGVVAAPGEAGDRALSQIQPLIAARGAQQGAPVRIYRPPPNLDELAALQYRKEHFDTGRTLSQGTPRYLLILGDLDEVPLALQAVLQTDALVGRLAFRSPEGYAAYVEKVLRSEARSAPATGRALFYTVPDGTSATQVGEAALVRPCHELAASSRKNGEFPAEVRDLNHDSDDRLSADVLLRAATDPTPTAFLSVSHGEGAPPGGFRSSSRQRERQGAMCFGDDEALAGSDVAAARFLQNGLWLMVACYGAGTPQHSAYQPWIEQLGRGGRNPELSRLLDGLPRPSEPPFIAALPQALLQNPSGPLAFISHIDLAWTYSFADLDAGPGAIPRPARFVEALRWALRGDRVGLCCRELMRALGQTQTEILALSQHIATSRTPQPRSEPRTGRPAGLDPSTRLGHLWMLRQDLLGYILLGDPAVRLPVRPAPASPAISPSDTTELAASLGLFGGGDVLDRPRSSPTRRDARAPLSAPPDIERLEPAIGALLAGRGDAAALAAELGLSPAQLLDYVERYRRAGRAALGGRPTR